MARVGGVLDVSHRPYDEGRPLARIGERPKQLVSETRVPVPPRPGPAAGYGAEHRRDGVANPLAPLQPLLGWRHVVPTDRRAAEDFARVLGWLAEGLYPGAEKRVLVTGDRNADSPARLYEPLDPARARRIAERLGWPFAPAHGSRLNVAEIAFAALSGPCPDRRIGSMARLRGGVAARGEERSERMAGVSWQFATPDARIELRALYPSIRE